MISVHNVKAGNFQEDRHAIYIGRAFNSTYYPTFEASPLGNPFRVIEESQRGQVIRQYHEWLRAKWTAKGEEYQELLKLAIRHHLGETLHLYCWCHPHACHGDVVKDAVEKIAAQYSLEELQTKLSASEGETE